VELSLRRVRPALAHLRRALEVREQSLGAEHPRVAQTLGLLGEALLEGGQLREARETLERAVALSTRVEVAPPERARACFALARVLWPSHEERPRALSLAREAQAAYARGAPTYAPRAREVQSWLSAHAPP
jgi:hypothetical protein